jgi:hypothetical protein
MMAATASTRTTVKLVRRAGTGLPPLIEIEVLAQEAGLHPDIVARLVAMGLVDPVGGTPRAPLFPRDAAARLARASRLRRDLGLNYAGAVLASELLGRIEELQARLRRYEPPTDDPR